MNSNLKIFFIILVVVFLSGCVFDSKKTEINLGEKTEEVFEEEKKEDADSDLKEEENDQQEAEEVEKKEREVEAPVIEKEKPAEKQSEKEVVKKEEEEEKAPDFKIIDKLAGWGFSKSSSRKIDTIVIHSSYNALDEDIFSLEKIIAIYKSYGVAPHYIISRDGKIYRMVEDKNIAYHAGESKLPDGRTNVNNFSIGIEIVNSKTEGPTGAQYGSLKKLLSHLKDQYEIKYTLGHSDVSPGRKDDPWMFEWGKVK
jgi:hypothetical protein